MGTIVKIILGKVHLLALGMFQWYE